MSNKALQQMHPTKGPSLDNMFEIFFRNIGMLLEMMSPAWF